MTPFHPYPDESSDQPLDQADLIAFHLHDLSPREERALNRTVQNNPTLAVESAAIAATLLAFPKNEPSLPINAALLDRNWQALRPSLALHFPPTIAPRSLFPNWLPAWTLPTLAASAIVVTGLVLAPNHHQQLITVATTEPHASTASIPTSSPNATTPVSANVASASHPSTLNHASDFTSLPTPTDNLATPSPATPTEPSTPTLSSTTEVPNISASPSSSPTFSAASNPAATQPASDHPSVPASTELSKQSRIKIRHPHTTELTLAVFADLAPDRSSTASTGSGSSAVSGSFTQSSTPAIGALASFHQQLRPWLGYRVTTSHSEPTFEYTYTADGSNGGNTVNQHLYEVSETYVVQGPSRRHISTTAEAGAALLAFLPAHPNLAVGSVHNAYRPSGVIGVSAEIALTRHWALHAGYRALFFKSPAAYLTYGTAVPSIPSNLTLSSNPVIGVTYRIGPTGTF